ncbi:MAG: ankyrin repeat domain-containing protein [bacterium]|nr:ankyrin repeat domain-containing protein [bacterium]
MNKAIKYVILGIVIIIVTYILISQYIVRCSIISESITDAAMRGSIEDVQYYIEKGADINFKGYAGDTPLHWASNDIKMTRLLVEHAADIQTQNNNGCTPLDSAIGNRNDVVIEYLKSKGAIRGSTCPEIHLNKSVKNIDHKQK